LGLTAVEVLILTIPGLADSAIKRFGLSNLNLGVLKFIFPLFSFFLILTIKGVIAYSVFMYLSRGKAEIKESYIRSKTSIKRVFISFCGLMFLGGISFPLLLSLMNEKLGLIIFGIAVAILWCRWIVVIPVCVIEKRGAIESFHRSEKLTKGHRWKLLSLLAIMFVVQYIINKLAAFIIGKYMNGDTMLLLLDSILTIPIMAFGSVMISVAYCDLSHTPSVCGKSMVNIFE
jgi:hypothetical protein